MKSIVLASVSLFAIFSNLSASSAYELLNEKSLYDVVAPTLGADPSGAEKQAGMIYISGGQFKGVDNSLNIVNLSAPIGGSFVISGGSSERVERMSQNSTCTSNPCTGESKSSNWITVGQTSGGSYSVTFIGSPFSAAPSCVVLPINNSAAFANINSAITTSGFSYNTSDFGGGPQSSQVNILCQGPL